MTLFSKIIYYLANPLLMPLYNLWLLFQFKNGVFQSIPPDLKWFVYLLIILMTVVFPIISIVGLKFTKTISSIHLENKKERSLPFALTIIYYGMAYYILSSKIGYAHLPEELFSSFLACIISICVVAIITPRYKISAHCVGIGGVLGSFLAVGQKYVTLNADFVTLMSIVLILSCGVVASTRLWLKAHTSSQVYSGLILGFLMVYCFVSFNWYI